jgi:hypothetical protein
MLAMKFSLQNEDTNLRDNDQLGNCLNGNLLEISELDESDVV